MGPIHEAASSVICKSHSSWHSEGDTFGNTGDDQAMPVPQPKAPNVAEIKDFRHFMSKAEIALHSVLKTAQNVSI